jgi:nucleoside-diphosphate-sugar epimerase
MRLDLIVNTMFKSAMLDGVITVNNPAIWRPILSINDAVTAYTRSIEANQSISGIFNVSSGNYTVGEVADLVKTSIYEKLDKKVDLNIHHKQDYRNYKVTTEKANTTLSFKPRYDIDKIVQDLVDNFDSFKDLKNPQYYNIEMFKKIQLDH